MSFVDKRQQFPHGTHVEPEHDGPPPHLRLTHPQYPDGFPDRENDALLGHWATPRGMVIVEHHPHGYELHFNPCYDFDNCDACSPDRGPKNPHTDDGHHFRECENRNGPILTVAADKPLTVLEYLSDAGSPPHVDEWARHLDEEALREEQFRKAEREETMRQEAEEFAPIAPSSEDRLAALEAEIAELRKAMGA